MPPPLRGPLALALAAISLRAFSSAIGVVSCRRRRSEVSSEWGPRGEISLTGPLLVHVSLVILVYLLVLLLRGLERLDLATCSRSVSTVLGCRVGGYRRGNSLGNVPSRDAPPIVAAD